MDSRTAAHILSQIAAYLDLRGENRFKARAYQTAAKGLLTLGADDLAPLYRTGELGKVPGLGPATLAVVKDLIETGESRYLEQLRESAPEGLLEMARVPGLTMAKIHKLHEALGIETLEDLEAAALDGRLAALPRWGPKTAEKILKGISFLKESGALLLYPHAAAEAVNILTVVRQHPAVTRAEIAGSIRRRREVIGDVDVVAGCREAPEQVAASFARAPGVRRATGEGTPSVRLHYVDGTLLDLHCVPDEEFAVAWWRATGSAAHEIQLVERLTSRGYTLTANVLRDASGQIVPIATEKELFAAAGLAYVEPELREGRGEITAAAEGWLPQLVTTADLRGVLHCHSVYSDGKATIAEMAAGARARGWRYVGITDHSESAFYAGGVSRDRLEMQHEEIDELNATFDGDFRVLKGIEADILADGRLDYDESVLDRFDFVIGSVHSRFSMSQAEMTERVLTALGDPHLTVLGHPTGRLLLSREPYAIDIDAVLERAAELGTAVEINADPHRLDLDWRAVQLAKARGVTVEIGPDAHSVRGMDVVELGVSMARKGWIEKDDVLNARSARDVLRFAERRRDRGRA